MNIVAELAVLETFLIIILRILVVTFINGQLKPLQLIVLTPNVFFGEDIEHLQHEVRSREYKK